MRDRMSEIFWHPVTAASRAPRFPTTWPRNDGLWGREWTTTARWWEGACAISNPWWCHVRLKLPWPRKRLFLKFPIVRPTGPRHNERYLQWILALGYIWIALLCYGIKHKPQSLSVQKKRKRKQKQSNKTSTTHISVKVLRRNALGVILTFTSYIK